MDAEVPSLFCDADVLVAGSASSTGASHLLLKLGELGLLDLVTTSYALGEAERNIHTKLPEAMETFTLLVTNSCRLVENPSRSTLERYSDDADPKDVPILAAAVEAGCSALVTFNVRDYRPRSGLIRVETPASLVKRLRSLVAQLSAD